MASFHWKAFNKTFYHNCKTLTMKFASGVSGLTALELVIAVSLSAVVVSSAYKVHLNFSKAASRENDKALLQRDLMSVCDMMEKDIRMAGLGLPGNGIDLRLSDTSSDELTLFVNKNQLRTRLVENASFSDTRILVESAGNAAWGKWVCVEGGSIIFREISRIALSLSSNPDTIHLTTPLNAGPFSAASNVYSADRISYYIKSADERVLYRKFNSKESGISMIIDSLAVIPKDNKGTSLSSGTAAQVISAVIGGYIGQGNDLVFLAESTEVNIRNVN